MREGNQGKEPDTAIPGASRTQDGPAYGLLLDRQLPVFDANQSSTIVVDAGTEQTYRAVRALDPDKVSQSFPFMRVMGSLRGLPARIAVLRRRESAEAPEKLSADEYREAFIVIDEEPGVEFVVGMIGKFMTATQMEFSAVSMPTSSRHSTPPDSEKVALNFLVQPYGTSGRCSRPRHGRPPPTHVPGPLSPLLEVHRPLRRPDHEALVEARQAARGARTRGSVTSPAPDRC